MKCSLEECQWNGFGSCCPESEEIYNTVIANSKECPSYWDLPAAAENERQELIQSLMTQIREMELAKPDLYESWLSRLDWTELVTKAFDMIESLWVLHCRNQLLDSMLEEIKQIGSKEFINKYVHTS